MGRVGLVPVHTGDNPDLPEPALNVVGGLEVEGPQSGIEAMIELIFQLLCLKR